MVYSFTCLDHSKIKMKCLDHSKIKLKCLFTDQPCAGWDINLMSPKVIKLNRSHKLFVNTYRRLSKVLLYRWWSLFSN